MNNGTRTTTAPPAESLPRKRTPDPITPPARWRPLQWAVAVLGALLVVTVVVSAIGLPITPWVGERLRGFVKERFASDLEFSSIELSLIPFSATIADVVFWHEGHHDRPPLVRVRRATAALGLRSIITMFAALPAVKQVELEGLSIEIDRSKPREERKQAEHTIEFLVDELVADGAILRIHPEDAGKEPLEFDLKSLRMRSVGLARPMRFVAELTNPTPPGLIHTTGDFGPWDKDDPGDTPLGGDYTFENADLGHFNGIGGILSSSGTFQGQLARIEVDGTTDTPDFHVDISGKPVHLKTSFHAIVDGTSGDTFLEPVTATFGESTVVARGGVYSLPGVKGKTVKLDVEVDRGRIEDMMRFADDQPVLTGPIRYRAKLEIPPGKQRVIQKLKLDGEFKVLKGRFTGQEVREKLGDFSNRARGEPEAPTPRDIATDFGGKFHLEDALLTLRDLGFRIPGAEVRLNGTYHLSDRVVDFKGVVRLEARVSKTTTGVKSFFLKLVDPLMRRKDGPGSEVPITIKGHRSDLDYGLDVKRVLTP